MSGAEPVQSPEEQLQKHYFLHKKTVGVCPTVLIAQLVNR